MSRLTLLAGSIALFAVIGVDAGLCRPSSITTTTVETSTATISTTPVTIATEVAMTTSTEVDEPTTTLLSTSTAQAEETEKTSIMSTTEATTTTADVTTTAIPTTTTVLEPPPSSCQEMSDPFTASNGASFGLWCGTTSSYTLIEELQINTFRECIEACVGRSGCRAVNFWRTGSTCALASSVNSIAYDSNYDYAILQN
ncbi:unnamed protein product [Fusarium venenatum]|uniref:Apple domain-containing protein n=1 Tax=Fusarium venenatum TaxID=56646 RepID=A0A2L2TQW0_9HYPO|nr:uncharacterized protein FVRRES_03949 [Fusarium venenatum]CEI67437.1 unnamed protein product [Fusarium venenatum]